MSNYGRFTEQLEDLSDDVLDARLERLQLDYKHADQRLARVRAELAAAERERAHRFRRRFEAPPHPVSE
jgi:hypothetical protein